MHFLEKTSSSPAHLREMWAFTPWNHNPLFKSLVLRRTEAACCLFRTLANVQSCQAPADLEMVSPVSVTCRKDYCNSFPWVLLFLQKLHPVQRWRPYCELNVWHFKEQEAVWPALKSKYWFQTSARRCSEMSYQQGKKVSVFFHYFSAPLDEFRK